MTRRPSPDSSPPDPSPPTGSARDAAPSRAAPPRRRGRRRKRRTAPGASPGQLHVDPEARPSNTTVIGVPIDGPLHEVTLTSLDDLAEERRPWPLTWINVDGLGDVRVLERIGAEFGLHPLALEDVVHVGQRPKLEAYGDHVFVVLEMRREDSEPEQLSMFIGSDWVLTFQEREGDCFTPVRERLRKAMPRIRTMGAGYLGYALIDAVIDAYFPCVDRLVERLERLEAEILAGDARDVIGNLYVLRHELQDQRRAVWRTREVLVALDRDDSGVIDADTRVFLRDCHDHVLQLTDLCDAQRELATGLLDVHLSLVSHGMNEVMKILTIMSSIFIPLSFLAGLWGMNFAEMPGVQVAGGFWWLTGAMAVIAGVLLLYFQRRGWLRRDDVLPPAPRPPEPHGS